MASQSVGQQGEIRRPGRYRPFGTAFLMLSLRLDYGDSAFFAGSSLILRESCGGGVEMHPTRNKGLSGAAP